MGLKFEIPLILVVSAWGQPALRVPCNSTTAANCIPQVDERGNLSIGAMVPAGAPHGTISSRCFAGPNEPLNVKCYGALGDGIADDTAAVQRWATAMKAKPGSIGFFPPGIYLYSVNDWMNGISGKILANGASFKCTNTGKPFAANSFAMWTGWGYWQSSQTSLYNSSYLIKTTESAATSIMTTAAGDASNFAAGDTVLIFGYIQQAGGWPPNPRYHELKKVVSVNSSTGVITLDRPLRWAYDSRWFDGVSGASFISQTLTYGAPRVMRVNQAANSLYIEGATFLKADADVSSPYDYGTLQLDGHTKVELVDVRAGYVVPSQTGETVIRRSYIDKMEIDKVLGTVIVEACIIGDIVGGTGADSIVVRDSAVTTRLELKGYGGVLFDNCDIYSHLGANQNYALASVQGHGTFRECRFYRPAGSTAQIVTGSSGGAAGVLSVAVAAVTNATTIEVALNNITYQPLPSLRLGSLLYTADRSNTGNVTAVYYNNATSRVVIEATFRYQPTIADVFHYKLSQDLSVIDAVDVNGGTTAYPTEGWDTSTSVEHFRSNVSGGRFHSIVVPIPASNGKTIETGGFIARIQVHVLNAQEGWTLRLYSGVKGAGDPTWSPPRVINCGIKGSREMGIFNSYGAQSGDSISALGQLYYNHRLALFWGPAGTGTVPSGIIVIDIFDQM